MNFFTYFLVMNPWNQPGKLPLCRMSGAWVSVNHFRASSFSIPAAWFSVSVGDSIPGTSCFLLAIFARALSCRSKQQGNAIGVDHTCIHFAAAVKTHLPIFPYCVTSLFGRWKCYCSEFSPLPHQLCINMRDAANYLETFLFPFNDILIEHYVNFKTI